MWGGGRADEPGSVVGRARGATGRGGRDECGLDRAGPASDFFPPIAISVFPCYQPSTPQRIADASDRPREQRWSPL